MIQQSIVEGNALDITCTFDAPVEKVFAAWAEADQMEQWMGPEGVTCEKADIDL